MPAFAVLFLAFFVSALLLLGFIVLVVFPSMFRGLGQMIRLFQARRRRTFSFASDGEIEESRLCEVEGIYHFDDELTLESGVTAGPR